jgi:hypothetical protein
VAFPEPSLDARRAPPGRVAAPRLRYRRRMHARLAWFALFALSALAGCRKHVEEVSRDSAKPAPSASVAPDAAPPTLPISAFVAGDLYAAGPDAAWVAQKDGFLVTNDGGKTFRAVKLPAGLAEPQQVVVGPTWAWAIASDPKGWTILRAGPGDATMRSAGALAFMGSVIFATDLDHGFRVDGARFERTTDGGRTWKGYALPPMPAGRGGMVMPSFQLRGGVLELELWEPTGMLGRFVSTDGGATLVSALDAPGFSRRVTVAGAEIGVLPSWLADTLVRSTDGGAHWTKVATPATRPMPDPRGGPIPVTHRFEGPIAIGEAGPVFLTDVDDADRVLLTSTDAGLTWKKSKLPAVAMNGPQAGPDALWIVADAKLHRTTDGASWTSWTPSLIGSRPEEAATVTEVSVATFHPGGVVWAIVTVGGEKLVGRSSDGGKHFAPMLRPKS